jgi:hypothetical protein
MISYTSKEVDGLSRYRTTSLRHLTRDTYSYAEQANKLKKDIAVHSVIK